MTSIISTAAGLASTRSLFADLQVILQERSYCTRIPALANKILASSEFRGTYPNF
ncbi:hypothetical protein BRCON_0232 [Candidatus Sumerlaea chitinivorans]|uniref:Uncharacterized protein n=1 Tax=Sumerlaea chitinivorans TaxID=2250252 RepID=A0A2Z4Y212_SUMC1|nr:hypothetical protein BRCON_0232 [Candidatus Sumerlaea chitinivorans]